ncbi:MAG: cell division ATPase MinD [Candidatus Hydrothermarchaeaceae archaeon]
MTGISVSIASGRGGAGKSTLCANLGVALSQMGLKTLVVDADVEAASMNLLFGLDLDVPTMHDYLSGNAGADEIVFNLKNEGIDLVVGSIKIESLGDVKFDLFKEFISEIKEKYDIILIDLIAGLSVDAVTSLSASDAVVLVVTPDILSVSSALKTKIITKGMNIKILGAVINRVGGEYDIPVPHIADMLGVPILGSISEDKEVKRSLSTGKILMLNNPNSPASKSIKQIASILVGESK